MYGFRQVCILFSYGALSMQKNVHFYEVISEGLVLSTDRGLEPQYWRLGGESFVTPTGQSFRPHKCLPVVHKHCCFLNSFYTVVRGQPCILRVTDGYVSFRRVGVFQTTGPLHGCTGFVLRWPGLYNHLLFFNTFGCPMYNTSDV